MRKKRFLRSLPLLLAAVLCFLSACGAPAPFDEDKTAASEALAAVCANDIAVAIIQETPIDNMTALASDRISLHYDFDLTLLDDYAVYISSVNTSADEISIFHLKEGADSESVVRALNTRIQMKMQTFQKMSPSEYEKLSHALLLTNDNYIVLLVCPKVDIAYSILTKQYQFPAMIKSGEKKSPPLMRKGD